ncbi:SDR family NAD(P)-dependent oxidoreductase, partial [candidate division WOR-3 bacterium]|nr:SDR family NAD(P)-dependent oxidoreductase [candidate division WOR-3 bacterium]
MTAGCRRAGVRAIAARADMASSADVRRLVHACVRRLGRLDVLVCNAGIWKEAAVERMSDPQLAEML